MVRRVVSPPLAPPDPTGLRLRAATRADEAFVRELSVDVFSHFGDYGAFLPGYLAHPSVFTTICEERAVPIGFTMLALVLSEQRLPGHDGPPTSGTESTPRWLDAELIAIAVDPRHQAHGVGKRLLLHALEFARAWQQTTGVRSVQLNVADTNRRALEFFTRTGFVVLDPNDGTYPRGQRSIRMVRLLEAIAEAMADPDPAREEPGSGDHDP